MPAACSRTEAQRSREGTGRPGGPVFPMVSALVLAAVTWGCGDAAPAGGAPIPQAAPELRPGDGLLESQALRSVVELQALRDGAGLRALLDDPDPAVRARAALALASVQDPGAEERLTELLRDPEASVRRDAAFALGRSGLSDGGRALVDALMEEGDPDVRSRLMEAAGRQGDEGAVADLLALGAVAGEAAWIRALARAALRGIAPEGLADALVARLDHADPQVREGAAYVIGQGPGARLWAGRADAVREALDGYGPEEPAAMHLALGLARLHEDRDRERLLFLLEEAPDWRVRASAARALGTPRWLEREGVGEALFRALHDESQHVGVTAAWALTQGYWVPPRALDMMVEWIRGPVEEWRVHVPFLEPIVQLQEPSAVIEWTRRMAGEEPPAAIRGLEILVEVPHAPIDGLLQELTAHPHPRLRAAAFRGLARRGLQEGLTEEERAESRVPRPDGGVDWNFLASLGPAPRLRIETNKGELVVRLVPDQAPLTVQALATQAMEGLQDDVPFHRVEPNFAVRGGDFVMRDGSGDPGYTIPTELTQISFRRGVVGMAPSGQDAAGSQFFILHSTQMHLDGHMTAFGWVESGFDVLDRIYEEDWVVRMRVERGGGD